MKSFRLILTLIDVWGSLQNIWCLKKTHNYLCIFLLHLWFYNKICIYKIYFISIKQILHVMVTFKRLLFQNTPLHPSSSWCSSRSNLLSTLESISLRVLHLVEKCMGSPAQYYNMKTFQYFHLIPTYETIYDALRKNKLRVYGL